MHAFVPVVASNVHNASSFVVFTSLHVDASVFTEEHSEAIIFSFAVYFAGTSSSHSQVSSIPHAELFFLANSFNIFIINERKKIILK